MIKSLLIISLSMISISYPMNKIYTQAKVTYKRKGKKPQTLGKQYLVATYDMPRTFPLNWVGHEPKNKTEEKYDIKDRWQQMDKEDQEKIMNCIKNIAFAFNQGPAHFTQPLHSFELIVTLHLKSHSDSIESIFDKYNISHPQIKNKQWVQGIEEKIKNLGTKN